jgi:hypothetical protein
MISTYTPNYSPLLSSGRWIWSGAVVALPVIVRDLHFVMNFRLQSPLNMSGQRLAARTISLYSAPEKV